VVRRRLRLGLAGALLAGLACTRQQPVRDHVDLSDTAAVRRAMQDTRARDSMLDTIPGGEMVRGDSAAELRLLRKKM
jgi:hypothetical protein